MIPMTLPEIAHAVGVNFPVANQQIHHVMTDTRMSSKPYPPQTLFIALKGKQFDGHDYLLQAIEQGACAIMVEQPLPGLPSTSQLVVTDTTEGLKALGALNRRRSNAIFAAITGSTGKTTVKEMVAAILSIKHPIVATKANCNNQLGVPLTLLNITENHRFGIIEIGTDHPGEIITSATIVQPSVAVITNIKPAHLKGFTTIEAIAQEKGALLTSLQSGNYAILHTDYRYENAWKETLTDKHVWYFSEETASADFWISNWEKWNIIGQRFKLHTPVGNVSIELPLLGRHQATNSAAAAAVAVTLGVTLEEIQTGLQRMVPPPSRGVCLWLDSNHLIIDDTYNANPGSLDAAIELLASSNGYRVLVAGTMEDLGESSDQLHYNAGVKAKAVGLDEVITISSGSKPLSEAFNGRHYNDKVAAIPYLVELLRTQSPITLLVKGSRATKMETLIDMLKEKSQCFFI